MFDPHIYARQPLMAQSANISSSATNASNTNSSVMTPHGSPQKKQILSNMILQSSMSLDSSQRDENQLVFVGDMGGNQGDILTATSLISNEMNRDVDSGAGSSGQASRKTSTIASSDYASSEYTPENTIQTQQNSQFADPNMIDELKRNQIEYQATAAATSDGQLMVDTMNSNETVLTPENNVGQSNIVNDSTPLSSGGFNLKLPPARKLSRFIVSPVVVQTAENQFLVVAETSQPRTPPSDSSSGQQQTTTATNNNILQNVDTEKRNEEIQAEHQNVVKPVVETTPVPLKTTTQPAKPQSIEELKKQLEDITHVHVPLASARLQTAATVPVPSPTPAPTVQVQAQISAQQQEKIKQEIQQQLTQEIQQHIQQQIQQQIQQTFQQQLQQQQNLLNQNLIQMPTAADMMQQQVNNSNIALNNVVASNQQPNIVNQSIQNIQSEAVNTSSANAANSQSSGPGSALVTKDNTSVYNSRRTSTELNTTETQQIVKTENLPATIQQSVQQLPQTYAQVVNTQQNISDPSSVVKLSPQHSLASTVG